MITSKGFRDFYFVTSFNANIDGPSKLANSRINDIKTFLIAFCISKS